MQVDIPAARRGQAREAVCIDMDAMLDWSPYRQTADFAVIGFPNDFALVDYDKKIIQNERVALRARYAGPATSKSVHTVQVEQRPNLTTFSGMSGGPVFTWAHRPGFKPQLVLAGVAIQGSVQSGLMHFIEAEVLLAALQVWGSR